MKRDWQDQVESYLKKGNAASALWLLDGVPIRELDKATLIMDKHKHVVMKHILTLISQHGLNDSLVDSTINQIRRTRVNWSEMDIILKSAHAEHEHRLGLQDRD